MRAPVAQVCAFTHRLDRHLSGMQVDGGKSQRAACGTLPNVLQRVVYRALLRLALMLVEIGLQLEFRLVGVQQKLLPRPEGQSADIAECETRRGSDESDDFESPVRHAYIMARCRHRVKCDEARGRSLVAGPQLFRSSTFSLQLVGGAGLRCRQSRRQHAKWRTGHVVHPDLVTELHRGRLPAVFSADANLQSGTSLPPALDS